MAINKAMRKVLKALSYGGIELEASRHLANIKALDPIKFFHKTIDFKIFNQGYGITTRIYMPNEEAMTRAFRNSNTYPILLFIHGGGWVTESVETYNRICARMSQSTNHIVISIEYRLAPEHRFPVPLEDCYAVAKAIFEGKYILDIDPERITVIGDSAGGNLTAALSLMARDRGEFIPERQILIYPALNNDYTENSTFSSVHENGTDYLLTARKMEDYLNLYMSDQADRQNPYFAPILEKDLSRQPKTLILTADFDPLRDEGELYGEKLKNAGNEVEIHRIKDALHGYFALGIKYNHVQESFELINRFLKGV